MKNKQEISNIYANKTIFQNLWVSNTKIDQEKNGNNQCLDKYREKSAWRHHFHLRITHLVAAKTVCLSLFYYFFL
jgi:hypothetical protein